MAATGRKFLLHCHGTKLARKDGLFGKSDPFVVIKSYGKPVGFSNVVMKDLNPYWEPISIDEVSCGGPQASLTVEVYDWDSDGDNDFIGSFTTSLQELVSTPKFTKDLLNVSSKKNKSQGTFVVSRAEEDHKPPAAAYAIVLKAKGLARKDGLIGKSDPFVMVYRYANTQGNVSSKKEFVAKTEYIMNNLSPQWQPVEISVHACGGLDGCLSLVVYDYDSNGGHDLIGRVETTLRQLVNSKPTLPVLDESKVGSRLYRNSGLLTVSHVAPTVPKYDHNIWKLTVQFRGKRLDKKDTFSKSDPYLNVKRDESFSVAKTEHVKNDSNPVWRPMDLLVQDCGGLGSAVLFEVWDHDKGSDDFIGSCKISLRHLMFWEKNPTWRLTNPKKTLTKGAGYLEVVSLTCHAAPPPGHQQPMQSGYQQPQRGQQPMQSGYVPHQSSYQQPGYGAPQTSHYGAAAVPQGVPYSSAAQGGQRQAQQAAPSYATRQQALYPSQAPAGQVPSGGQPPLYPLQEGGKSQGQTALFPSQAGAGAPVGQSALYPSQQSHPAPQQQSGHSGQQSSYGNAPQQSQYGNGQPQQQSQYGAPQAQSQYGNAQPQQSQYGNGQSQQQSHYGTPQAQSQYGNAQPQQSQYGNGQPQQQSHYGNAQPQQQYGNGQAHQQYGNAQQRTPTKPAGNLPSYATNY